MAGGDSARRFNGKLREEGVLLRGDGLEKGKESSFQIILLQ